MHISFASLKHLRFPTKEELKKIPHYLTRREWIIFAFLMCVLAGTTLGLLFKINQKFMIQVPAKGGTLHEGIVGTPRFVNPVLALTQADKDVTALVYSGLMRRLPDGSLTPDLAESYTISDDGLTYTFTLKKNAFFHDGKPVTADDILYTIERLKDPIIKSPHRIEWEGVTVTKIDDHTLTCTLKQRFAAFLENATVGILPMHVWNQVPVEEWSFSDLNTSPIGSGPYEISKKTTKSGGGLGMLTLKAFPKFVFGRPYISKVELTFFPNEHELVSAYQSDTIDMLGAISPEVAENIKNQGGRILTTTLPRIFGLFFNQNQMPLFADKKLVQALSMSVDKNAIVEQVLLGYGTPIDSPIPQTLKSLNTPTSTFDLTQAQSILEADGWTLGADNVRVKKTKTSSTRLAFSIATSDAPELKATADILKQDFEALGASVEVKVFDIGTLNQSIIRPRKYDTLLFGQIVSTESDLFAFWHSSQRNDPGLNVAMYTNPKVDDDLEKAQATLDPAVRASLYQKFETEIKNDMPALFLYSPEFVYVVDKHLDGITLGTIVEASDRFNTLYTWYLESDSVWKPFVATHS